MNKKIILIDLDGVLNDYTGNFNQDFIPPAKDGAKNFLLELSQEYTIKIFTTRNKLLTAKWLIENNLDKFVEDITNVKEISWLYIDDRGINFDGNFIKLKNKINKIKPYYKK
ncbi:MAG: hypothetical protein K6C94_07905 [Candidatus Gastranaerophilales bacterium]|nr:hypothetical protein [Candidatus Gastranaerophilales bacterium]